MKIELPIRLTNILNQREHWTARNRRAKKHRRLAYMVTPAGIELPVTVIFTRIAPRPFDGDGMQASCKSIRDGVADKLGVNDNDARVTWIYLQRKGKPKTHTLEIEFA